jgi:hypothetical protein
MTANIFISSSALLWLRLATLQHAGEGARAPFTELVYGEKVQGFQARNFAVQTCVLV